MGFFDGLFKKAKKVLKNEAVEALFEALLDNAEEKVIAMLMKGLGSRVSDTRREELASSFQMIGNRLAARQDYAAMQLLVDVLKKIKV